MIIFINHIWDGEKPGLRVLIHVLSHPLPLFTLHPTIWASLVLPRMGAGGKVGPQSMSSALKDGERGGKREGWRAQEENIGDILITPPHSRFEIQLRSRFGPKKILSSCQMLVPASEP